MHPTQLTHDAAWRLAQKIVAQRTALADADTREAFGAVYQAAIAEMEKLMAAERLRAKRLRPLRDEEG